MTKWSAASAVFGKMTVKLFFAPVLGIGETPDPLVAHAGWVTFEPHPAGDLFRRPPGLEPIFYGFLEFWTHNQLSMDGATLLIHVLGVQSVITVQLSSRMLITTHPTATLQSCLLSREVRHFHFADVRHSNFARTDILR